MSPCTCPSADGFPSNSSEPAAKAPAPKPEDKPDQANLIDSLTPGRFEYEFRKDGDVARFDFAGKRSA